MNIKINMKILKIPLKIIKKKLDLLLRDLLDIKVDFIINSLYKNLPNIQKEFNT